MFSFASTERECQVLSFARHGGTAAVTETRVLIKRGRPDPRCDEGLSLPNLARKRQPGRCGNGMLTHCRWRDGEWVMSCTLLGGFSGPPGFCSVGSSTVACPGAEIDQDCVAGGDYPRRGSCRPS